MDPSADLLPGTLDLLILKAVSLERLHGYGVLLRIQQGSLYPALYRLEAQGFLKSEWGESENKRKAKYYKLTPAGRKRLRTESEGWTRFASAVAAALSA